MKVLYIDCDTLRPDHLGCYGYPRNTSPNIDAVAGDAVIFDRYYCSDAPCLPSRAALMTGKFGFHTGVVNHGGLMADMRLDGTDRDFTDRNGGCNLPYVYRRAGMYTASISTFPERHSAWWFNAGFQEMHNVGKGGMESTEEVTPVALSWLRQNKDREDWFLHVHYWDPHTPFRAPESFGNPFADVPLAQSWITQEVLREHQALAGPHTAQEVNMYDDSTNPKFPRHPGRLDNMADVKRLIDGYDCGVRYMDDNIGMLLQELREQGIYDDVAIVVSADHGENIGELGIYSEHGTADEATTHIPLIVKWPGMQKNVHVSGLHYNVDFLPTMTDLMEGAKPAGEYRAQGYDGESFLPALEGTDCMGREYLVVSQCAHVCQRAVRFDRWIYIRTYHDGYHLFDTEMLFDLENDVHETVNLAKDRTEVCRQAVYYLDQWVTENMFLQVRHCQTDPMWTVIAEGGPYHARGHLKTYCERLEKTGRGWAVPLLKERHPNEFH